MAKQEEKTKRPVGRPTKYYPEIVQELVDWFDQEPYEDVEIEHYGKNGEIKWIDKKRMPRQLPTLINFARAKGIGLSTIYDWIDPKHSSYQQKFSDTYTRVAKTAQREVIIQNGLNGTFNPIFTKFVAVNMTDMRDKQDMDHGGEVKLKVVYESSKKTNDNKA